MQQKQELTETQKKVDEQLKEGLDDKLKELAKLLDVEKIGELWGVQELMVLAGLDKSFALGADTLARMAARDLAMPCGVSSRSWSKSATFSM